MQPACTTKSKVLILHEDGESAIDATDEGPNCRRSTPEAMDKVGDPGQVTRLIVTCRPRSLEVRLRPLELEIMPLSPEQKRGM